MSKKAFDKIADGLTEAISIARKGQSRPHPQHKPDANQNIDEFFNDTGVSPKIETQPGVLAEFMNTEELAAELNVTPITLIRWRLARHGPPITRLGRRILYRRSSVEAWLAAQETEMR